MNKIIQLFLGCAIVLSMASCEGGTTFTKSINNTSSETLSVIAHASDGTRLGEVAILPGDEKQVYWNDKQGEFATENYSCTEELDSINVSVSNGKVLILDLMDSENWNIVSSADGKDERKDCTATISDSDLQ